MSKQTAREHRYIIRSLFRASINSIPKTETDQEIHFYNFLNHTWEIHLFKFHHLCLKENKVPTIEDYSDFRVILFLASVGLMTYGRKDVIPLVLQDIPKIARLHYSSSIVTDLLPLPSQKSKKTEILDWLEIHYDQLTWDEEKEVFYLEEEG